MVNVRVRDALAGHLGERLSSPYPNDVQDMLIDVRGRIEKAQSALRAINTEVEDAKARKLRGQQLATRSPEAIFRPAGDPVKWFRLADARPNPTCSPGSPPPTRQHSKQ